MIYTSYFAKIKSIPDNYVAIAICLKVPTWFNGVSSTLLSPSYSILKQWQNNHDELSYKRRFVYEILERLDPYETIEGLIKSLPKDIQDKINSYDYKIYNNPDFHIVLLCYESSEKFYHRHIVSKWFRLYGISCEELK